MSNSSFPRSKVLNSLKLQLNLDAPKPFPQSAQYQNSEAFAKKEKKTGGDEEEDEEEDTKGKPTKKSKKKKHPKKKRADIKNTNMKPSEESVPETNCAYKAKEYSMIRKEFIDNVRQESGLSARDASERWNQSAQKNHLLAGLSVPELRRRRFIPAGCDHNPWALAES